MGFLLTLGGCEEFLTETNPNEITADLFWRDLNDAETGIIAVYNSLRNPDLVNLRIDPCRADIGVPVERKQNAAPTGIYYQRTYNSSDGDVLDKWRVLYTGIFRANQVIEGLEGVVADTVDNVENLERWNGLMGQARFFRGLFHYWAYLTYNEGSVIIVDKTPEGEIDEYYRALSSPDSVRAFFREDLRAALSLLPQTWIGDDGSEFDLGKVTRGAAAAYLGQSFLYEASYSNGVGQAGDINYDSAMHYFDIVMNSGYSLVEYQPDENLPNGTLCTTQDELNEESIFEIVYDNSYKEAEGSVYLNGATWAGYFSVGAQGAFTTIVPSYWTIMAYKEDPMDLTDERNQILDDAGSFVRYRGNEGLSASHINRVNLRLSMSVAITEDEDKLFYGSKLAERRSAQAPYGAFRKFANWDITTDEKELNGGRSGINHRLMRLSDVYLMYAECLINGGSNDGGVDEALVFINRVRRRAALELLGESTNPLAEFPTAQHNETTYTALQLMEHIQFVERPLELCLEGYNSRQIDLRRWGILKSRLEDLAQRPYYVNSPSYTYRKSDGTTGTSGSWVVNTGEHPTNPNSTRNEWVVAANNHNEAIHNYYPIPTNESGVNPNVQTDEEESEEQ